jgi:hypothetical protein
MVERLAAAPGGGDEDAEILPRRLLADELVEALRTQRHVRVFRGPFRRGDAGGVGGHQRANFTNFTESATIFVKLSPAAEPNRITR